MTKLPSLPENAHISDLFDRFPASRDAMMQFTQVVMREDGALPVAVREMIAAYVSGLNQCTFCHGSHLVYAEAFGIPEGQLDAMLDNLETAPVAEDIRALLGYVQKLNTLPSKIIQADINHVLGAGWSEDAVFEAVQICGLFNMMNRIIEGSGVRFDYSKADGGHPAKRPGMDVRDHSYANTPMGRRG